MRAVRIVALSSLATTFACGASAAEGNCGRAPKERVNQKVPLSELQCLSKELNFALGKNLREKYPESATGFEVLVWVSDEKDEMRRPKILKLALLLGEVKAYTALRSLLAEEKSSDVVFYEQIAMDLGWQKSADLDSVNPMMPEGRR